MTRKRDSLTIEEALRFQAAARGSGYTDAELNSLCGMGPMWLHKIYGPSKLVEGAHRPVPGGRALLLFAHHTKTDPDYLLGITDYFNPMLGEFREGVHNLVERLSSQLFQHASSLSGIRGNPIGPQDILRWLRETGGVVGTGADIEEHFDIVQVPGPDDNFAAPLRVGAKSLAGSLLGTEPDRLKQQIQDWPLETQRKLAGEYRSLGNLEFGASIPVTEMSVEIDGCPEPVRYWSLKASVRLLGPGAPPAAICFAFR